MPSFKQKNVIKSYKLRLQNKFKTVTEETENAILFLNNCLLEFKTRVDHILEIKNEKCLSLYRDLTKDLEKFSEKLDILQLLEEGSEDSDSEIEEDSGSRSHSDLVSTDLRPSTSQSNSSSQNANSSSQNVASNFSVPSIVNANVITELEDYHEGGSVTEDDFCSLPSDSVAQNIAGSSFLANTKVDKSTFEISHDKYESTQSFSPSSCYRSLSSNISEPLVLTTEVKVTHSSQAHSIETGGNLDSQELALIRPPPIEVPSTISGTLSYIVNPGDFWIQIENSFGSGISYPKSEQSNLICPSFIKKGNFYLAPLKKSSPFFYRAQSLSNAQYDDELVKVHFVDHGSTQDITLCNLRHLPFSAYDIPAQAIHCYLDEVAPTNGSWSDKCIERFKAFQNSCIETVIKSKESLYAVKLITKPPVDLNEDYSVDIALSLCLDGLAISENESLGQNLNLDPRSSDSPCSPPSVNIDSPLEVSSSYNTTSISNDSGVSVTFAYKSSQSSTNRKDLDNISGDYVSAVPVNLLSDSCDNKFKYNSHSGNLISFESCDALHLQTSNENLKSSVMAYGTPCLICNRNDFCLHFKIPPPSLVFVEKNMMIVMLSHIVNPHEFYVNMAMENIDNLDELREQMTTTYDSQRKDLPLVSMEDLSENMFCAGYYEADNHWYRVKIIRINSQDRIKGQVFAQYVDYGNTATIKCADLLPLTPEFSKHSTFAIRCSLAGTLPVEGSAMTDPIPSLWNEDAINAFKQLTSFGRCLTAEFRGELCYSGAGYPVLLWDTEESNDLLINRVLDDLGVAKFDCNLLHTVPSKEVSKVPNNYDILNEWDPMTEEFNDIQNSYGVDNDDLEVITSGHRSKDGEYVCNYYSLRGYCPRGGNCTNLHVPLLECGVTRDTEEVYCMDILPLIPENTPNMLVQVSAVINPGHFYVILPFGCKSVDEINFSVKKGTFYDDMDKGTRALFHAINKHYSDAPFQEDTTISLSLGTIVVAKCKWDMEFHRGRVVDVSDVSGPSKIFFVDSGYSEWVPRKLIRTILPQYLHTPFQAVQCCLHGVKPIESEENRWSADAVNFFKDTVEGETLLAEIVHRFDQVIHVSLRKTSQNNHRKVGDLLVSAGLAMVCSDVPAIKKESRYVPG